MNAITRKLTKLAAKSGHNGKIRTLKRHVVFADGSHWKKGRKVRILGVTMLFASVQLMGDGKFEKAMVSHSSVNWK